MTQPTSQDTIPTRFLLLSDTHNRTPASPSSPSPSSPFRLPLPSSDVLLHAGDLTMSGGASNYREIIKWLATSDAELKLVIAGNHDIDLDADYYRATGMWAGTKEKMEKVEKEIREAREVWTGAEAAEAGVVYLEEGVREFYLSNGAWFTIYTSPYQPEFCGWAFAYPRHIDRFNPPSQHAANPTSSPYPQPPNPIPSHPAIDIILTHGPPLGILDRTYRGENVGCRHLLNAVQRVRPRLCVFGHIHEGRGAERRRWGEGEGDDGDELEQAVGGKSEAIEVDIDRESEEGGVKLDFTKKGGRELRFGEETLFVNAAILDVRYRPVNAPWVVDLELARR